MKDHRSATMNEDYLSVHSVGLEPPGHEKKEESSSLLHTCYQLPRHAKGAPPNNLARTFEENKGKQGPY